MESSSKPSLSNVSISTTQTSPSKLSVFLSPSFRLSSSVPIRAPLTLDDDEENENDSDVESNDNRYDSSSSTTTTALSVTGSESESNEDDPDEENCTVRVGSENKSFEESEGSSLRLVVRPIAQLSWDSDDNSDLLVCSELDFEVDSFGGGVDFVPSVSVAPRVKVFEALENEEEEEGYYGNVVLVEGNGGFEESDSVKALNVDLGIDRFCVEKVEIDECDVVTESRGFGALEAFGEESGLMASEEEEAEEGYFGNVVSLEGNGGFEESESMETSKVDSGIDRFCVENVEIEKCNVIESRGFGDLEAFCEGSDLMTSEEGTAEKNLKLDLGIEKLHAESNAVVVSKSCEETNLVPSEKLLENKSSKIDVSIIESRGVEFEICKESNSSECYEVVAEKSSKADLGTLRFCVEKAKIVEKCNGIIGVSESCEKSNLGPREEISTNKSSKVNVGVFIGNYEESNLAKSEEVEAEKSTIVEMDFGQFCSDVVIETQSLASSQEAVTEKSSKSDVRSEQFNVETNTLKSTRIENYPEEANFEAKEEISNSCGCDFSVSLEGEERQSQKGSCLGGISVSNQVDQKGFDDANQSNGLDEESKKKKIEHLRLLRVKFLRLVQGLGISLQGPKVTRVLNKLVISSGQNLNRFGPIEEAENETDFEFSLNILVLGKSGVGKSSTINLILGEKKASIDAFKRSTTSLNEFVQTVNGAEIRILDTPGLKAASSDRKLLSTVRKWVKKFRPDIVLYVDRLDMDTKDADFHIMKSITDSLGSSIWKNAIIVLTHSSSAPLDGPLGLPISNEIVAARKSILILESIGKSVGNLGTKKSNLGCQVTSVENHPTVSGDPSNGRSELLLLCYSIKILSLANLDPKREKSIPNLWWSLLHTCQELGDISDPLSFDGDDLTNENRDSNPTSHHDLGVNSVNLERDLYVTDKNRASFSFRGTKEEESELSCVPRNETELRNLNFEKKPFVASLGDDVAAGFEISERARGARFVVYGKDQNPFVGLDLSKFLQPWFVLRVVADETGSSCVRVVATGSGLVPVALGWVLQMLLFGLVSNR